MAKRGVAPALAVGFAAALLAVGPALACAPDRVDLRADGAVWRFQVDLADTPATRARGLMFVESLPRFSGMLFVYDAPQVATFWMENTLIPLDMLFMDASGTVTRIHPDAVPLSRETIFGGTDVQFVLEINGGLAAALGIPEGAEMRHPAVDPALAAWPCEDD